MIVCAHDYLLTLLRPKIDESTLNMTDADNPVLLVTVEGRDFELPVSKRSNKCFRRV